MSVRTSAALATTTAAAVLSTVLATVVSTAGPAAATWPGGNGRLVLTYQNQVYTVQADGTHRRKLTSAGKNYRAWWSKDGTRLAYLHEAANGDRDLWTMKADGSAKKQVTRSHRVAGGSFSPDGSRLVYADSQLVWTVASNGTGTPVAVTGCPREPAFPAALPGACTADDDPVQQLRSYGTPAYSPDGRLLVMLGEDYQGIADQAVLLSGGNGRQVVELDAQGGGGTFADYDDAPSWAPDGSSVAFAQAAQFGGPGTRRPRVLAVPGRTPLTVTPVVGDFDPAFSPDGTSLATARRVGGTPYVFVSRRDGSGRHRVSAGYQADWQPVR